MFSVEIFWNFDTGILILLLIQFGMELFPIAVVSLLFKNLIFFLLT